MDGWMVGWMVLGINKFFGVRGNKQLEDGRREGIWAGERIREKERVRIKKKERKDYTEKLVT